MEEIQMCSSMEQESFNSIREMNIQNNAITSLHDTITNDVCRICLSSNSDNKCIYSVNITNEIDSSKVELRQILELHGGIELNENDGLPSNICRECILKVNTANILWKQCQLTDQKLRAIYKKPERNRSSLNSRLVTDRWCQTEGDLLLLAVNENNIKEHYEKIAIDENVSCKKKSLNKNVMSENYDLKKNANIRPRLSMVKRVTSIENLKIHKDQQRNYAINSENSSLMSDDIIDEGNSSTSSITHNKHYLTHKDEDLNLYSEKIVAVSCNVCKKVFKKTEAMIKHLNIHKKTNSIEVYNILKEIRAKNKSNKVFIENNTLRDHKNSIINGKVIDDVDEIFSDFEKSLDTKATIKLINIWIKKELSNINSRKNEYYCATCGKFYITKKSLIKHNRDQHDNDNSNKTTCNKRYCTDTMKENNAKNKSNQYQCNKCNKIFEKKLQLQEHMKIHDDNENKSTDRDSNFKRFLCHICSKTFRQNTGLMFHMRTHTGYKPHVCKYCGRGFTSNSNCKNHERTHTGDRPFICHFCSAAFAKSCTLKAHITTHTGEANYHCETCGKSFKRLKYLKEHTFTHTGEKPFVCKICGTAYSHSGSLFFHEKKCKAQLNNSQSTSTSETPNYYQSQQNIDTNSIIMVLNSPLDTLSSMKNTIESEHDTNGVPGIFNTVS